MGEEGEWKWMKLKCINSSSYVISLLSKQTVQIHVWSTGCLKSEN